MSIPSKISSFPAATNAASAQWPNLTALPTPNIPEDADPSREIRSLIEQLQATVQDAVARQQAAEGERDRLAAQVSDLEFKIQTSRNTEARVQSLIRERDSLIEHNSRYSDLASDLARKAESADLKRLESMRDREDNLRRLDEMKTQIQELQKGRDEAVREKDVTKREKDSLATKLVDAQRAMAEAQRQAKDIEKNGSDTDKQLAAIRHARDHAAAVATELRIRVSQLEDEIANIGYDRDAAQKAALKAAAEVEEIRRQVAETQANQSTTSLKFEELSSELTKLRQENQTLKEAKNSYHDAESSLAAELDQLRQAHEGINQAHLAEVTAIRQEIETRVQEAVRQAGQNTAALEHQIQAQQEVIQHLQNSEPATPKGGRGDLDYDELKTRFEQQRLETIEIVAQLQNAQREIRELSANLAEARLAAKLAGRSIALASSKVPDSGIR